MLFVFSQKKPLQMFAVYIAAFFALSSALSSPEKRTTPDKSAPAREFQGMFCSMQNLYSHTAWSKTLIARGRALIRPKKYETF